MKENLLIYLANEKIKKLIKYCKDPEWSIGMRRRFKSVTEGYLEALARVALELDLMETREKINKKDKDLIYFDVYTGEYEDLKNFDTEE